RILKIPDGTSNTLLVGEEKYPNPGLGQNFYQLTEGYAVASTIWGINNPNANAGGSTLGELGGYYGQGYTSYHPGGANFAFADASVRFLADAIDLMTFSQLGTRNNGDVPGPY